MIKLIASLFTYLLAILQVYQLSGRTSEIYSVIEINNSSTSIMSGMRPNNDPDKGHYQKILLLYHDALCKIQRGKLNR